MEHSYDRRVIVYPAYINSERTVAEGRRIPKQPGCDNPTAPEIFECVTQVLKLPAELENKAYSREWLWPGRVRVQLKSDSGAYINSQVTCRKSLLLGIADALPKLQSRLNKPKQAAKPSTSVSQPSKAASTAKKGSRKR